MKPNSNSIKKIITNLVLFIFIFAVSFLISMLFLDVFVKYPENITQPGTYKVTLFNYILGKNIAEINEEGYLSFIIIKYPIYDILPFILSITLFLISILIITYIKKWVKNHLY